MAFVEPQSEALFRLALDPCNYNSYQLEQFEYFFHISSLRSGLEFLSIPSDIASYLRSVSVAKHFLTLILWRCSGLQ